MKLSKLLKFIKRDRLKSSQGFSLVELMVVVAIIGILAAVAIPNYQKFQRKSQQVEAKTMLSGLYASQITFMNEWNALSAAFDQIGFESIGDAPRYTAGWANGSEVAKAATVPGYRGPPAAATPFVNTGLGKVGTDAPGPAGCRKKALCDSAALKKAFNNNTVPVPSDATKTCAGHTCTGTTLGGTLSGTCTGACNCSCSTVFTNGELKAASRTFVIGAAGDIGGSQEDLWYMTYNKELQNVQSGVE